jgi:glycosyltransferase involved in cell wall biosynthesis
MVSRWFRSVGGHGAGGGEGDGPFRGERFDVVHVFRLAALPYARPWLDPPSGQRPERHLDLDDVESITRRRLAALYRLNGAEAMARYEEAEAERAEALEREVLERFDRVYVCSECDRAALLGRAAAGAELWVLPNALAAPDPLPIGSGPAEGAPRRGSAPFTLLFVGTLGYYPNEDGIRHFCTEVVPLIRARARREFLVHVVGTGATPAIQALEQVPEVRLIGVVPDVAPWYADADAVIVPVRSGGGTRIKVLEAVAYRRPVVSTSIGIEGIDARDGEHVLVGDTPEALAEGCRRLMEDPELAERLVERAYALFTRAYSMEAVARAFAGASPPPPPRGW